MDSISQVINDCEMCAVIKQAKRVKPLWYGGQWSKYKYGEAWQIDYITLPQTCQAWFCLKIRQSMGANRPGLVGKPQGYPIRQTLEKANPMKERTLNPPASSAMKRRPTSEIHQVPICLF
ncbi:hypothetical protein HGM15179_019997 [Zosterops borbonicus]|uniref:Integrase zinc-binding domain-containing protein n=1 Tax=Zosterops borbonicus TaxID=364589 RepID=A0A8K1D748_9PASS|nr:hypothetical protein HGM15179_019997 [Zosterops borbonicus]